MIASEEFKAEFSANLKRLRKAAGLTQPQLGTALGFSDKSAMRMIQKWERMEQLPYIDKLRPLCKALGCTLEDLIPEE